MTGHSLAQHVFSGGDREHVAFAVWCSRQGWHWGWRLPCLPWLRRVRAELLHLVALRMAFGGSQDAGGGIERGGHAIGLPVVKDRQVGKLTGRSAWRWRVQAVSVVSHRWRGSRKEDGWQWWIRWWWRIVQWRDGACASILEFRLGSGVSGAGQGRCCLSGRERVGVVCGSALGGGGRAGSGRCVIPGILMSRHVTCMSGIRCVRRRHGATVSCVTEAGVDGVGRLYVLDAGMSDGIPRGSCLTVPSPVGREFARFRLFTRHGEGLTAVSQGRDSLVSGRHGVHERASVGGVELGCGGGIPGVR